MRFSFYKLPILLTFFSCLVLKVGFSSAQLPQDPYNKPAIWFQLQKKPFDALLWQKYVGKQWTKTSNTERVKIKLWIQEMWLNQLNNKSPEQQQIANHQTITQKTNTSSSGVADSNPSSVSSTSNTNSSTIKPSTATASTQKLSKAKRIELLLAKPEVKSFMKDLEDSFMAESVEMEELKEDLYENFFIIESVLADEFEALGQNYVYYEQKHPNGNYSESRWMDEQQKRLKALKQQKLEEMKQAFLERQLN